MSGHTQGPWNIVESSDPGMVSSWNIQIGAHQLPFFPYKRVYSECRSQSGLVSDYEMHANARLIAAAPDLLEALRNYVDGCSLSVDALAVARAAISKAAGAA